MQHQARRLNHIELTPRRQSNAQGLVRAQLLIEEYATRRGVPLAGALAFIGAYLVVKLR
jgi:hypothetical protein